MIRASTTSQLHHGVVERVRRHLSRINADLVVKRGLLRLGITSADVSRENLVALADAIGVSARAFLASHEAGVLVSDIATLAHEAEQLNEVVEIHGEADVKYARSAAQAACMRLGAAPFPTQRAITVVSELARNIASYAGNGAIELRGMRGSLTIIASDTGRGIKNLEEILAGRYVSRTGLGKGLLGVKKLATHFAIETSPRGTRIDVEVSL